MCRECVVCVFCMMELGEYLCLCVCVPRKSLPKAQLPSLWRMVPSHLIYLSRKWKTHFFLLWYHSAATSLSFNFLLLFFLLHNFFQSCRLNVLSRLTWQDRTWSPSSPLGMSLIPTFPSLSKVRWLDRSLAMELRYCSDENILLSCPPFFRC